MIVLYLDKIISFLFNLLFLITPLIVLPFTSELFEFNKIIFIYLITVLILFFWILKMILLKKIILKKTPFEIPFFLFFLSQILSTLFSIDQHTSIFGFYGRFNGGLLTLITYLILYYSLVSNLSKNNIGKILKISLLSSIITVIIGLTGKLNRDLLCLIFTREWSNNCWTDQFKPAERMFSTLGQPNWLGAYLSVNFFIALYHYFKISNLQLTLKNLSLFFTTWLIFIGILFSRSRSAILSVITLTFFGFFILYIIRKIKFKKLIFFLFIFSILIIILKTGINQIDRYFYFKRSDVNDRRPTTTSKILVTESLDIRKIVWQGAIELGKKYPLFGTGVETFGYSYYFTRPKEHNLTSEWDYLYNRAHNEYLNILATSGFFGLGTYLLMVFTILFIFINYLIKSIKEKKEDNFFLTFFLFLGYLSILFTNFFGFSTSTIGLLFYLIPAMIIVIKKNQLSEKNELTHLSQKNLFFIGLISIIFIYLLIKIINYWLADYHYAKSEQYSKLGYYQEAINSLNQALKLKYEHVYEDELSGYLATVAFIASNQNEKQLVEKLIGTSNFFNEKAISASPKNILYLKTKAKNHYLYYQATNNQKFLDRGIKSLIIAQHYAPTEPKIPYNIAIFYNLLEEISKNKNQQRSFLNKALNYINKAVSLKPNYRDGLFLKAQLLLKINEKDEAKKVLKMIIEKIDPLDEEVKKELEKLR